MEWLNGKKTIIGAVALIATYGPDIVSKVLPLLVADIADVISGSGGDPAAFTRIAASILKVLGGLMTLIGLIHKVQKVVG